MSASKYLAGPSKVRCELMKVRAYKGCNNGISNDVQQLTLPVVIFVCNFVTTAVF